MKFHLKIRKYPTALKDNAPSPIYQPLCVTDSRHPPLNRQGKNTKFPKGARLFN